MGKNQAQINYRKKAVKTLYLDLNIKTDADIIQWLDKTANRGGSKSGEIKRACRNLIPKDAYQFLDTWHCPSCPAKYTPVEGQLISYCPRCGQAIINITGKGYTPVDSGAERTPVDDNADAATLETLSNAPEPSTGTEASADGYTPVDNGADTCTPVDSNPDTYTPVDDNADDSATLETLSNAPEPSTGTEANADEYTPVDSGAECTPVDTPNYEIFYITKKGGEHYRSLKVYAKNAKEAIAIFRAIHKETFQKTEGHAFQPKAKRMT